MRMVFPNHVTGRFVDDLASDMNTLVQTLFGEAEKACCGEESCDSEQQHPRWVGPMDVVDSESGYQITIDLPGVDAEKIEIDVEDEAVLISADRVKSENAEGDQLLRTERRFGRFHRKVSLPKPVDREATTADYVDGVLTVTLPKAVEEPVSRRVQVKRGGK